MNIEQYRALKEQEANQTQTIEVEQPDVPTEQPKIIVEEKPEEKVDESTPTKIKIGDEEVDLEELKNGYLRQSDYTKKTQEVSRQKQEAQEAIAFYEHLKKNPQAVEQLQQTTGVPGQLDPTQAKVNDLESKLYDMMLEREIEVLKSKYDDFEVLDVLNMASEKQLTNLEDAYHLVKSTKVATAPDVNALKEQIRQEILNEINLEKDTKSIISSNDTHVTAESTIPTINSDEVKVAKMMGMTEVEYIKWRDAGNKK